MAGAYCVFCDRRCFVYREVIENGEVTWSGHMATCHEGRAHDRKMLGVDADGAYNPAHRPRPDDDPTPGNRCKDCGRDITWLGPGMLDWEHV